MDTHHTTQFPSIADRKGLLQQLQKAGWNLEKAFTEQERWFWHAYDYGLRRFLVGDDRKFSPIDPDGKWFDQTLAAVAEKFYRTTLDKRPPPQRSRQVEEAAEARELWARACGCSSFEQAMALGLANVAKRGAVGAKADMGSWRRPAQEIPPPLPRGYDG
jgi:hypothetical protein